MSLSRKLGMKRSKRFHNILYHVLVCLFGFLMIYPLLWMVMSSFKESSSIFRESYRLIPDTIHFENYINGWKGFGGYTFGVFFSNSFLIAIIATIGAVFSSAIIAFGFARLHFRGQGFWFSCVMLTDAAFSSNYDSTIFNFQTTRLGQHNPTTNRSLFLWTSIFHFPEYAVYPWYSN